MGLGVVIGLYVGTESGKYPRDEEYLYPVLQDCLRRHNLPIHEEPQRSSGYTEGPGQGLHDLAEYCREQHLPYQQITRITCSEYQLIVPIDFIQPIPEFDEKSPESYGLSVPESFDKKKYVAIQIKKGHSRMAEEYFASSYPYYRLTPPSDIYMLSSQQLLREVVELAGRYRKVDPQQIFNGEFWEDENAFDDCQDKFPIRGAFLLYRSCKASIETNRAIFFSG